MSRFLIYLEFSKLRGTVVAFSLALVGGSAFCVNENSPWVRPVEPPPKVLEPQVINGKSQRDSIASGLPLWSGDLQSIFGIDKLDMPSPIKAPPASNNSKDDEGLCATSNPVIIATGEKFKKETDFTAGGMYGLELTRTYRSKNKTGSLFGIDWRSTLDFPKIKWGGSVSSPDYGVIPAWVRMTDRTGATYTYSTDPNDDPIFYRVNGSVALGQFLYVPSTKRWILHRENNTYNYDKYGRLTSISGPNSIGITYDSVSLYHIVKITNSTGKYVTLTWTGERVTAVTDAAGNSWTYSYDANNMLKTVTSPGTNPDVRTYLYENSAGIDLLS